MPDFDLSLYLVTDRAYLNGRNLIDVVRQAIEGGVTLVQLREKDTFTRDFYEQALQLRKLTQQLNVPLIINDRLDIALAVDADGLHIGQNDLPYTAARKLLGYEKIIGLSVETIKEAEEANDLDVDYIGISPVFSTPSKADTKQPFLLDGVSKIASFTKHPTVGIGGVNSTNLKQIIEAGADGIAVISAILSDPDPKRTSELLISQIKAERSRIQRSGLLNTFDER